MKKNLISAAAFTLITFTQVAAAQTVNCTLTEMMKGKEMSQFDFSLDGEHGSKVEKDFGNFKFVASIMETIQSIPAGAAPEGIIELSIRNNISNTETSTMALIREQISPNLISKGNGLQMISCTLK